MDKVFRLWKPVAFTDAWRKCDTSILDDIAPSWLSRRKELQENSKEYQEFLDRLKREHAIETGVIERIYDLKKGITETLIKEGFVKSYLSHGDSDISKDDLMKHLGDHLEAVDFVFDIVKENRSLSVSFIKELHQLTIRHQKNAEGRENNPTASDGTKILYCPPIHVDSELDNLVKIYSDMVKAEINPLIIAAWFHHAFVTIHPFQDGNGRVARLLTSLIFIKFGFFPFTVLREEAKVKYINALEKADVDKPQSLVEYLGQVQRRNVESALNLKELEKASLDKVLVVLNEKLSQKQLDKVTFEQIQNFTYKVFQHCKGKISELRGTLHKQLGSKIETWNIPKHEIPVDWIDFPFYNQTLEYSVKNNYAFDNSMPKIYAGTEITLSHSQVTYRIIYPIHGYGYGKNTLAIGFLFEFQNKNIENKKWNSITLDIPPHTISVEDILREEKSKNIKKYIEDSFTLALAQIVNEI